MDSFEYKRLLLDYSDVHQKLLHERVYQTANIMVVTLSFVFLLEATFVGAAFPEHASSIQFGSYMGCLSLLFCANVILVTALIELLYALSKCTGPWVVLDDYFCADAPLDANYLALRYAISKTLNDHVKLAGDTIKGAQHLVVFGIFFGALSAVAFYLNVAFPGEPALSIPLIGEALISSPFWNTAVFLCVALCIFLFLRGSIPLHKTCSNDGMLESVNKDYKEFLCDLLLEAGRGSRPASSAYEDDADGERK